MNWRRVLSYVLSIVWIAAISAVMIVFHSRHSMSFQPIDPLTAEGWARGLAEADQAETGAHHVFHLLARGCGCSKNVLNALETRPASRLWRETVIVLISSSQSPAERAEDENLRRRLEKRGYQVKFVDQSSQLPTQGVPSVVAFIGSRNVYAGGYLKTRVNDASELGLDTFFAEIETPGGAKPRPIFGCSVSKNLRQAQKPEEWFRVTAMMTQEKL